MSEKVFRIFTTSPGSTSTKLALFENQRQVFAANVTHDAAKLGEFGEISEQLPYRRETILCQLEKHGVSLEGTDAFAAYSGGLVSLVGGTYAVNDKLLEHSRVGFTVKHPAILGAQLVWRFAQEFGGAAYVVDPPDTDEFCDVARLTGLKGIYRESRTHALNQKEVARRTAAHQGAQYSKANVIVAHMGGGLSVTAHRQGRMIDSNDVINGDGPMAPTRAGALPAMAVAKLCFSGKYTEKELYNRVTKTGGLVDHLGTSDVRDVVKLIDSGDKYAELVYDGMAYQVAKAIGGLAAALEGDVAGIGLTGGMAHEKRLVQAITKRVKFIAPVCVFPGDFEMEALANGALRVLLGQEEVLRYTGVPVWNGF